jgi:hypothetical protein
MTGGSLGAARARSSTSAFEYVGLILLVSLLMVGMVAAMKGFNKSLSWERQVLTSSESGN